MEAMLQNQDFRPWGRYDQAEVEKMVGGWSKLGR